MGSSASKDTNRPSSERQPQTTRSTRDAVRSAPPRPPIKQHTSPSKTGRLSNNNDDIVYRDKDQSVATTLANTLFEQVFRITTGHAVGEGIPDRCVLVPDVAKKAGNKGLLTNNNIEEAVFERLLASNTGACKMVHTSREPIKGTSNAGEPSVLRYLYHCSVRWKSANDDSKYSDIQDSVGKCKTVIFQNTKTSLQQPGLFQGQDVHKQFIELCIDSGEVLLDKNSKIHIFMMEIAAILESERGCVTECLVPVLRIIKKRFLTGCKVSDAHEVTQYIRILRLLTCKESLAKMMMEFNEPDDWKLASSYELTLIGSLIAMNPCPRTMEGPYEFFMNAVDSSPQEVHTTIMYIWQRLNDVCENIYKIFMATIRLSTDLRHAVLKWLGKCIEANRGKPDLWSAHEAEVFQSKYCSDGFCLNLCHVLLQMCEPFSLPNSDKLLKIKPSYCRVVPKSEKDVITTCVHAAGLSTEATFVPFKEELVLPEEESYHFISECFFLTHQALHIGYSIVYKIIKLNGSITRLRRIHEEIKEFYPKKVVDLVKNQLKKEICWYLSMKAAITEYRLTKMCLHFNIATASWLVQVATRDDVNDFQPITLPLPNHVPKSLSYLPEFLMTNMTMFFSSLDIFKGMDLLLKDKAMLDQFVNVILVFMGSPERLVNSDVRAKLSESLEAIVPTLNDDGVFISSQSGNDDRVFKEHPLISHLAEMVLNVFVSIEMTGHSVDDEKKFNYRKSMHLILQYIWRIPIHKQAVKAVSERALTEIDNTDPPLFLRFINLLVNDAIFLLDEALDQMKQIRVQELDRDEGKWNGLSAEQMRDKETGLRNLAMMGRYRNIMANHTIYTLEIIAREIRSIFCHEVMVDRIAGMLNYFLEQLVSAKQKEYKVKDRKEHEFKPEQIVSDITHIYVYLGTDERFCRAVLGEARSFSHDLFAQALVVLNKIGIAQDFVSKFENLKEKLEGLEGAQKREDDIVADAPDEFLDPIMGTLMLDPVTLPSSNTNIDRAVIARHLLSDQRDPFTNMALSMDMVVPNTELKEKIRNWRNSKLQS